MNSKQRYLLYCKHQIDAPIATVFSDACQKVKQLLIELTEPAQNEDNPLADDSTSQIQQDVCCHL